MKHHIFPFFIIVLIGLSSVIDTKNLLASEALPSIANDHIFIDQFKEEQRLPSDSCKIVFFGFTDCGGPCPAALSLLTEIYDKDYNLPPFYFITLDPERDSPEKMNLYGNNFHSGFTWLSTTPDETENIIKTMRVYRSKIRNEFGEYDHSALVYILNSDNLYTGHFSVENTHEEIVKIIKESCSH